MNSKRALHTANLRSRELVSMLTNITPLRPLYWSDTRRVMALVEEVMVLSVYVCSLSVSFKALNDTQEAITCAFEALGTEQVRVAYKLEEYQIDRLCAFLDKSYRLLEAVALKKVCARNVARERRNSNS